MMKKNILMALAGLVAFALQSSSTKINGNGNSEAEGKADAVYVNGNVYTVNPAFERVSAIAVKEDRILLTGSDEEVLQTCRGKETKVIDLNGKTLIPGIIESHLHYQMLGEMLERIDIYQKPKQEILAKVRDEAERLGPGKWIVSMGWNNELWNEGFPTREELDAAAPANPVVLNRIDGHSAWCNSLALQLAGINKESPDPQGGEILRQSDGSIWGILTDTAMDRVMAVVADDRSDERIHHLYSLADQSVIAYGITSLADAGATCDDIRILKDAYAAGTLHVRAYEMLAEGEDSVYIRAGNKPAHDLFHGKLSVGAVKLYSDGSLGSRSAWLLDTYSDRENHKGNGRLTDEEMYRIARRVAGEGFQIATHAIGDAAVRQVISVQKRVIDELGIQDHRFRIEHFQIVNPEDIHRAISHGFIPSMQPTHATSDMNMAEDRLGSERILTSYAWRTVLEKGGIIAGGSDAPVEVVNPFLGIYAAISRKDVSGQPPGGWYPDEKMSREEALKSFTIWGAYAMFAEQTKGSLEKGKYADFAVLDRDILSCDEDEVKDTKVLATVIGGNLVYGKLNESCRPPAPVRK
jgi:predicted amidohydrolase YtcJ